jgi:hypothetical protein
MVWSPFGEVDSAEAAKILRDSSAFFSTDCAAKKWLRRHPPKFEPLNAERAKHADENSLSGTLRELRV